MNTETLHLSDNSYSIADFALTIVAAIIGAVSVFAVNQVPGLYGIVLDFLALFWLGYIFSQMPARWWGFLIMNGASLWSFFETSESKLNDNRFTALLLTAVAALTVLWGFREGAKRLSGEALKKFNQAMSDSIVTLMLSVIGFGLLYATNRVPYAGVFLAIALAFLLGWGLGWIELPAWSRVTVILLSFSGLILGLKWGFETTPFFQLGVGFLAASVFLYGFWGGSVRAKTEEEREMSSN